MRISSIQLKNFKRFTDLTIDNIPPDAKLVLLIGSNGSGKSSVFDAFGFVENDNRYAHLEYYRKNINFPLQVLIKDFKNELFSFVIDEQPSSKFDSISLLDQNSLYGRTSFRHIPRLTQTRVNTGQSFSIKEEQGPRFFIDRDNMFESDIEIISARILKEVFRKKTTSEQIQRDYVDPINNAFERIFGTDTNTKLTLLEIIPPLDEKIAQINFRKGESEIHYNLLSAGEKEITNILFDLLVQKEQYTDTIYFLDELDLHLNTKLQYNLIKEITENWIPENCQLWTASHSLGFIEYANDYHNGVIIDFDDFDFDKQQVLRPSDKSDYQVFELAVSKEFIDKIFQGRRIVFSENTDTPFYNDLSLPNIFFFTAIDKTDVFYKSKNLKTLGLVDRDYLTDEEIISLNKVYPDIKVLPYYSIENLLFHPENLSEYYSTINVAFDKKQYIAEITAEKNDEKDYIAGGISKARDGYPFYKENENSKRLKEFKDNWKAIIEMLRNDDFETFYKVFPAKDYGAAIAVRQNLHKKDLAKTSWFRQCIETLMK